MSEISQPRAIKLGRFLSSFSQLFWKLATHRYDLCYLAITCHGHGFLKDFPFVLLCKVFGNKTVIHQHNKGMSQDSRRWPYRFLLRLAYRDSSVILLSQRLYPDIQEVVHPEKVLVCPNGIKIPESFSPKHSHEVPRLLFLSNLLISKGVFELLDALAILQDKGCRYACDFVGDETKEITHSYLLEEIKKRGLDHSVTCHGALYGEEKERLWSQTDILVFPSYSECFPLVVLEAMAHGLPVITSDEGGIPDMVKDGWNGLICPKQDPVALAACIQELVEDLGLRKQMGINGLSKLRESFTEEVFEKRMAGILHLLTNRAD